MTTITSPYRSNAAHAGAAPTTPRSRTWAYAGVAAAVTAVGGGIANTFFNAAYNKDHGGDASWVRDHLGQQRGALLVFHVLTMVSVVLLPVFAAGLVRRLRDRVPAESLIPTVAGIGIALLSVIGLIGTGMDTEFLNGPIDKIAPADSVAFFGHWTGTMPWLWAGAGIAGVAVGIAARAHRAVPRWIGLVGLVLGGLTVLAAVSPLQYVSNMTGGLWLLVTTMGFAFGDRMSK